MSRVTKAYKSEPRRSSKEKHGGPSQRTSDRISDRSSKSDAPTEEGSCGDSLSVVKLENKISDPSSCNFSSTLGTVGEHKLWNVGSGDSNISTYSPSQSSFCKGPIEHPVDSNGRPSLRIMIPTLPISNRRSDELPNAPTNLHGSTNKNGSSVSRDDGLNQKTRCASTRQERSSTTLMAGAYQKRHNHRPGPNVTNAENI